MKLNETETQKNISADECLGNQLKVIFFGNIISEIVNITVKIAVELVLASIYL